MQDKMFSALKFISFTTFYLFVGFANSQFVHEGEIKEARYGNFLK